MIIGIGTDIIEISRIKKACLKESFIKKVFTAKEIEIFGGKKYNTLAGNFAAKEAVAKALGTGISGFKISDIEILRNSQGKPIVFLHNKANEIYENLEGTEIHISISHCVEYAAAYAVIEK